MTGHLLFSTPIHIFHVLASILYSYWQLLTGSADLQFVRLIKLPLKVFHFHHFPVWASWVILDTDKVQVKCFLCS